MKESGVEWIGEIPEDWEVRKLSSIAETITDFVASGSFASLNENVKYLDVPDYAMLVRTVDLSRSSNTKRVYIDKHAYDFLSNSNLFGGELILSNIGSVGNVFMYEPLYKRASIAPNAIMIRMQESNRYYYYWFLNPLVNDALKQIGNNAVQAKFNKTQLRQFLVARPSYIEQQQIANFLDQKVAEIDHIIEQTKLSIEEYKKYKQSLITETVTKGLNPDVKMKDSGIEWIGEIPEHWDVTRLKRIISTPLQYGANASGIAYSEEMPRYIRITDITMDNKLKDYGKLSLPMEGSRQFILKDKDILFARSGATVGKTFIYKEKYGLSAFAGYLIKAEISDSVLPELIYYYTLSSAYNEWKNRIFIQATIQNIGADKYSNMEIVIPKSKTEQQEVIEYLDERLVDVDNLIAKKQHLLTELESYKKSLIFECVTGKREVM